MSVGSVHKLLMRPLAGRVVLWGQLSFWWRPPAGVLQWHRVTPVYVLETVHDVFGGDSVCGGRSFIPHARPQKRRNSRPCDCECKGASAHYLVSSVVVVGVENRPPLGNLGCALRHRPTLVLRGGVTLVSPRGSAQRACQWRRGAWSRACATRRGPAPGVPTRRSSLGRRRRGALGSRRA
jgi:hypothetical protein